MSTPNPTKPSRSPLGRHCVFAVSVVAALALAPSAVAAGDPVESGNLHLRLSKSFKKQLKRNGAKLSRRAFTLRDGDVNPLTGQGEVSLRGKLRFKHRHRKVVYRDLTVRLGRSGVIKGTGRSGYRPDRNPTKLFRLRGGSVSRVGFGSAIKRVKVKLLRKATKRINRRLGLHSLRRGRAGSLSIAVQPRTVEVTGGTARFTPASDTADGSGTLASKLDEHCVNFISGNTAISPGVKDSTDVTNPFYVFPVSGGTVGPDGAGGEIEQAGGIRLVNSGGGDCATVAAAALYRVEWTYNLLDRYIDSRVVVDGAVPTAGETLDAIGSVLDLSNATVSADPDAHTVTINGISATNNAGASLVLNQTFAQPAATFDQSAQFAPGDQFGRIDISVTTR